MFNPCLFYPSDNVRCSRRADPLRCAHFSIDFIPSRITQQISVVKYTRTNVHQRVRSAKQCSKLSLGQNKTWIIHQCARVNVWWGPWSRLRLHFYWPLNWYLLPTNRPCSSILNLFGVKSSTPPWKTRNHGRLCVGGGAGSWSIGQ